MTLLCFRKEKAAVVTVQLSQETVLQEWEMTKQSMFKTCFPLFIIIV